jgi:hypothetical protein
MDQTLSRYSGAHEIAQTSQGMMLALPEEAWQVCSRRTPTACVAALQLLARKVRLDAYRTSPRGPTKPRPQRAGTSKVPQVSTATLLREQHIRVTAL